MIAYEASTLRYYPDPVSGEFAIVALLLAEKNPQGGFSALKFNFGTHTERLSTFFAGCYQRADWTLWRRAVLDNFRRLSRSYENGAPLLNETFEALLNSVSPHGTAAFRWGTPFLGADESIDAAFEHWFKRLVTQHDVSDPEEHLTDEEFWQEQVPVVEKVLQPALSRNLVGFDRHIGGEDESFRMVWRNGTLQAMEVVSLTVRSAKTIRNKQLRTTGKLWDARRHAHDLTCSVLVSPPRDEALRDAFARAKGDLREGPGVRTVLEPAELPEFLNRVLAEAKPLT